MSENRPPNRFSIAHRGVARGPLYDAWRDGICRGFCRLDVGPAEENLIDCRNTFTQLNAIAIAVPAGLSARFARTRTLLADGCDDLVLISAARGVVRVIQGGIDLELPAGQMCLTEMNAIGSADITKLGSFIATRFPRRLLLEVSPSAEALLARPLGHNAALNALIDSYTAICDRAADDLDAGSKRAAAQHLTELVGLLLGTGPYGKELAAQRGLPGARFEVMKDFVLKNLSSNDLSVEVVAKATAISTRSAQRLFEVFGWSFSGFVLEQRLLLARKHLLQAQSHPRKVSEIAYAAGFNDLSYFHRAFRKRFGVSPAEMQGRP